MIKKNIIFFLIVVICVTILGQLGKCSFKDQGLCDIETLEDIKKYSFYFESVDTEEDVSEYREHENDYVNAYGECKYIFIVSPTGKYKMGTSNGMQEVKIIRTIKGENELENAYVWINGMPGLAYYDDENVMRLDALLNYMQEGNEYLIFCDSYGPVMIEEQPDYSRYYYTDVIFGYLNITKKENTGIIIDQNAEYTFDDLKDYEFFGTCQSVLDERQKIKNELIELYMQDD